MMWLHLPRARVLFRRVEMPSLSSSRTVTNGGLTALFPLLQVSALREYELPVHLLLPPATSCGPNLSYLLY